MSSRYGRSVIRLGRWLMFMWLGNYQNLVRDIAFVHFLKVKDEPVLKRKLREIWMGSYHLFAFVARFSRDVSNKGGSNVKRKVITPNSVEQVLRSKLHADAQTSSYANVVKGDGGVKNKKCSVPVCIL
ncbi:unnamed protein product [Lactuca virosa]|uniref:Uncharacterized protein n=1 Tax=Lactuca virosa TaxID=75947 RepID=A0AAU9M9L5_9ASTR|nr:unnamed protein product [Lactuca virosa]